MRWLTTIATEGFGLLVDDGRLALLIVIWLLLAWLALPRLGAGAAVSGLILFAGLAAILLESVMRRAAKHSGDAH